MNQIYLHNCCMPFRQFKYYQLLGVERTASTAEIKKAYRILIRSVHPDVNADEDALEKTKLLNKAFSVLSNIASRKEYDDSPAECPVCYTHHVAYITSTQFRCLDCNHTFFADRPRQANTNQEYETIPLKDREAFKMFLTTQCSQCSRFFTTPFLCPYSKLQSSCFSFSEISTFERSKLLLEPRYWRRALEMLKAVERSGTMAKCRYCMTLNPNPRKRTCWRCGEDGLTCPGPICSGLFLDYSIASDSWKCPNTAHGATYKFVPKTESRTRPQYQTPSENTNRYNTDDIRQKAPETNIPKTRSRDNQLRPSLTVIAAAVIFIVVVLFLIVIIYH